MNLDDLTKNLDRKFIVVALLPAIVPTVVMYLIEHETTVNVITEAALFDKKYQAVSEVLRPFSRKGSSETTPAERVPSKPTRSAIRL